MSSRYAAAHVSPEGPGDRRPTALQIVQDEGREGKLTDKVIFITGCSSGIGAKTARALAATGATLFLAVRDMEKGKRVLADVLETGRVQLIHMDLSSLASIRTCSKEFLTKSRKLNVLISNGAVMRTPEGRTVDGFETQFGTNHLGHFLLFSLLKPLLLASVTPEFHSRVVAVTSSGHRRSGIQFDNINLEDGAYDPGLAYAQSKTANIYMMNEIERRYGSQGLHGLSVHPGGIFTGLQKFVDEKSMETWRTDPEIQKMMKSPQQGAATTVLAALGKEFEGRGALYLEDCREGEPVKEGYRVMDPGYEPHAFDQQSEKRLWEMSLRMIDLQE